MKRGLAIAAVGLSLTGCSQEMGSQPSYREYEPAPLFRNGRVLQAPVAGTVARGDIERAAQLSERPPLTRELLERGRQEFDVFCSPCHGRAGDGNGIVVQRGMPRPPDLHADRLRSTSDQHIVDVITSGYGAMYSYASRVPPRDRWAIVAYVRALQLSQHASLDDVPADERTRLLGEVPR
jgi:mono/diheme cytochrome c family protein